MSQVRQELLAAGGTTWSSAAGAAMDMTLTRHTWQRRADPNYPTRSLTSWPPRPLDLEDRRLPGDDRQQPLENTWSMGGVRRLGEADISGSAVGKYERRRAEHTVLASRLHVIATQRVHRRCIGEVCAEPLDVQPGVDRHALDDHHVVDVQPVAVPSLEQRHVQLGEGILAAGRLGSPESPPAAHVLPLRRFPGCPPAILVVHPGPRKVTPGGLYAQRRLPAPRAVQPQGTGGGGAWGVAANWGDAWSQAAFYAVNGPVEEAFFRGRIQGGLGLLWGAPAGFAIATLIYVFYHRLGRWTWSDTFATALVGVPLGLAFWLLPGPPSLLGVSIAHIAATCGFLGPGPYLLKRLNLV